MDQLDSTSSKSVGQGMGRRFGIKAFFQWIEELKRELGKVSWTTRAELTLSTKVVIISIFAFGFGIYCVDFLIKRSLDTVATVARLIFG